MTNENRPVLIVAGGTGGHVMPALAVAEYLLEKGIPVEWLGTKQGIEHQIIPQKAIPIHYVSISGLRGKSILKKLVSCFKMVLACSQAIIIMRRLKPKMMLSMGGYTAGPAGVAAWLLRIPLIIHEQNAIAGLTNQLLSRLATKVLLAYPGALDKTTKKSIVTGNPLRQDFIQFKKDELQLNGESSTLHLLVLGGSLGAQKINQTLPEMLKLLPHPEKYEVHHQTGNKHFESTQSLYQNIQVKTTLKPFIEDIVSAYLWADIIICRAGALTVAEVAQLGRACIFIPYPFAVDNHQFFNAKYLSDQGGAFLMTEDQLNPQSLLEAVLALSDPEKRLQMMHIAKNLAQPMATVKVANECLSVGN